MKKKLFYYLFAVLCTVALFTSCSDDDDNGKNGDDQIEVADISGNYKGTLVVSINGSGADPVSQVISIIKSGDQTSQVVLSLKNFSFANNLVGDIEVPCTVEEKDGVQSFSGQKDLKFTTEFGQMLGTLPTSISGTVKDGKVSMKIGVTVAALGQTVDVAFEGDKMSGNESGEAKISDFVINSDFITEQPIIDDENGTITFKVNDAATDDDLKALIPTFNISDKATVSPVSGVAQDFSSNKVVIYTVTAEDGTMKTYSASISGTNNIMKFSFEEWKTVGTGVAKHEDPLPSDVLASSVQGASLLGIFGWSGGFPVEKTGDAKDGEYAIKLITLDTHEITSPMVPALTSGSLYTGSFDTTPAFSGDQLSCTKFGVEYNRKPLTLKGWYKYTPGDKYMDGTDKNNVTYPEGIDECAIQGVLYEAVDENEQPVTLTGHNINDSKYRVATAALSDGSAKTDYTYFELPFTFLEGKEYDVNKKYKLAIICSSSKDGDRFIGAGGSTLIIDALEVVGE